MSGGKRMRKGAAAKPATARRAARKPASKPAEPAMDLAVGRRIRDLRRSKEMSLEVVAARTDLSIGFISQIERGLSSPSLRVLATLADVLGVCPSSDNLRLIRLFAKRGSGSSGLEFKQPAVDAASGGLRWCRV
ncbi:ribosome-binding protein aMBF1 (putative translation factor) [Bradyrhizobium elkanii]|nr:ribosome-binding protein aMBF1 (putative translation factor) [Bradyrhizobium elkanii]MCW2372131.1 ribosome-binding protein aMBF1 (putative translation factor) [Bradyrhizobium elkanii]